MKAKLYLFTAFILISQLVLAQKYNVALTEDWVNNAWVNSARSTNTYDANGNLLTMTTEIWTSGAWQNAGLMNNTLNSDGTIKESLIQVQDSLGLVEMKTAYTYNTSKKVLTATTQMGMEGTWLDFSKITYTYNEQDQLTNQVTQAMNFMTFSLENSAQNIYTYNSDGTENQIVSQTWGFTKVWENSARQTNTYNNSKQVIADLHEKWDNNAWVNDFQTNNTYTAGGLIQESVVQDWNGTAWVNSSKDVYSYNDNNDIAQVVSQEWNTALSQWDNTSRITFSYGASGFNPIELTNRGLVVFPNPFTGQVTIQSKLQGEHGIEVFNAAGQLIYSVKTPESILKLDLGWLNKGVYLIKTPQNNQSIKVLKTK